MLKRRIIPIQLLRDGRLVKTVRFDAQRDVGDPVASSKVYSAQNADELVFLNIHRDDRGIEPLLPLLQRVSAECFMPLALGGGIRTFEDAATLLRNGADKIVINSAAYDTPALVTEVGQRFGEQAVMVSIDVRRREDGTYALYADGGRTARDVSLEAHVEAMIGHGAGELLITSIDRDGTMEGYDEELLAKVVRLATVPVIGAGGAGHYDHLKTAFLSTGVSALACGSLFNFGDNNPIRAKAHLKNHGLPFKLL